jgi:predicted protein tyrosine phosphatase
MRIQVHSRDTVQHIDPALPYAVISVTDPLRGWANVARNSHCQGVLQLHFHDADRNNVYAPAHLSADEAAQPTEFIYMDETVARQMIDFVLGLKDKIDLLVCQCDAGIARSAGIAGAFGKILLGDDMFIFTNSRYKPNMLVYRTILETYYTEYYE